MLCQSPLGLGLVAVDTTTILACLCDAENGELSTGLLIQGLDAETAWAQLRVIKRCVRQQGDPL